MLSKYPAPLFAGLSVIALFSLSCPCLRATEDFNELSALATKYGTDKGPGSHNYTEAYEYFFRPIKDTARNICEIGIEEGASLKMWEGYFRRAAIYGIDIVDSSRFDSGTVKTFRADQANREQLKKFTDLSNCEFDVLLDDGGHSMEQQQVSLGFLFKNVRYGGYYVIEDVHTSLMTDPEYGYGIEPGGKNTTLKMINGFIASGRIESGYMTEEEMKYLNDNIKYAALVSRNQGRSIACVFKKNDRSYPETLLDSCLDLAGKDKKEPALEACKKALYAAESAPEAGAASFRELRSEASLKSYELLSALGRAEEARETLFWTVENAPASWPRLAEAKRLLGPAKEKRPQKP